MRYGFNVSRHIWMLLFGYWEILKKSTQLLTGSRYSMSTIVGMSLVSAVLEDCVKSHSFSGDLESSEVPKSWQWPCSCWCRSDTNCTVSPIMSSQPRVRLSRSPEDFSISLLFVLSLPSVFAFLVSHLQALLSLLSQCSLSCYSLFSTMC